MSYYIPPSGVVGAEFPPHMGPAFDQCDAWLVASLVLGPRAHDHLTPLLETGNLDYLKRDIEQQTMVSRQIADMWPYARLWIDTKTDTRYICVPHSGWGAFFKLHVS